MASRFAEGPLPKPSNLPRAAHRLATFALASLVFFSLAPVALAQSTGGRVGGFGSSSGSGYRPSYRPSTTSYDSSSNTTSTPPRSAEEIRLEQERLASEAARNHAWHEARVERGTPEPDADELEALAMRRVFGTDALTQGALAFGLAFGGTLVLGWLLWIQFGRTFVIRRLSLAVGPEARAEVQQALRSIAAGGARTSPEREKLVGATLELLRRHAPHVRYALWSVERHRASVGKRRFVELTQSLRERFRHETVGGTAPVPHVTASPEEGPGLVVVTLIATGAPRRSFPTTLDVPAALDAFHARWPVGVELIWSPSESNDRMSSAELETLYPELARLSNDVGRVTCAFCGALHAKELRTCPACGATTK